MSWVKRFFDQDVFNVGSEVIPPYAVMEVKSPGYMTAFGKDGFAVGKPSSQGKVFFINSPIPIQPNQPGSGAMPYRAPGVEALFKPDLSPATNQELGPVADQWYLGPGNGFFVIGGIRGNPASQPGFPAVAATKRVRVMTTAVANETDRIQGTVASTASATMPAFLINQIVVLSGKDPRPEPVSPIQSISVQNTFKKDYTPLVDRVTATRNKNDGLWYVETDKSGGGNTMHARLVRDLRTVDPKAKVKPLFWNGNPPVDQNGEMEVNNVVDLLFYKIVTQREIDPTRYIFNGNKDGLVVCAEYGDQWYISNSQPPVLVPAITE